MKSWKKGAVIGGILYALGGILSLTQIIDVSDGSLNMLFFMIYIVPYMFLWGPITSLGVSEGIAWYLAHVITLLIFSSVGAKITDSIEKYKQRRPES